MTDPADVIARAIAGDSIDYSEYQHARVFRQVNTILAALDAKGLCIVSRDEADARVAVAERKGMERAQSEPALISALAAEFQAGMERAAVICEKPTIASCCCAEGFAAAIRADMGDGK